jgi:hypothetical protein
VDDSLIHRKPKSCNRQALHSTVISAASSKTKNKTSKLALFWTNPENLPHHFTSPHRTRKPKSRKPSPYCTNAENSSHKFTSHHKNGKQNLEAVLSSSFFLLQAHRRIFMLTVLMILLIYFANPCSLQYPFFLSWMLPHQQTLPQMWQHLISATPRPLF